jgi:hypothetical protein
MADITQFVEIDLKGIPKEAKKSLEEKIKLIDIEDKKLFRFEERNRDKLLYATEVLLPITKEDRMNLLIVVGNPAIHSVAEGIFFSYEKRKGGIQIEHRFWRALREFELVTFPKNINNPTRTNNKYKRDYLLSGDYKSKFNLFLLPYFSFPTPASGKYNGVAGIRRIVGRDLFAEMKEFEAQRFERIISSYAIENVLCFHKGAWNEIRLMKCKPVNSYYVGSTRLLLSDKGRDALARILSHMPG